MKYLYFTFVLIALVSSFGVFGEEYFYNWRQPRPCRSAADCQQGECCAIGFMRFSSPVCKPMGDLSDWCYEDNEPENRTLHYPNGAETYVNIYLNFCPCKPNLSCIHNTCASSESSLWNYHNVL